MADAFRLDYQRLRRFLSRGGHLQRTYLPNPDLVVWHSAARNGQRFDADTCEWLKNRASFRLDGVHYRLGRLGPEGAGWPDIYRMERHPDQTD